jgi:2-oxoglutarate dehydrogenase E2 component (dihydrolipoamide succinyltransferase)
VEAQQTAALLTTFNEVDMSAVMALRSRTRRRVREAPRRAARLHELLRQGGDRGLRAFPQLNAEIRGTEIVYKNYYDIGVAVGTPKGLVVPVLRDADSA